MIDKMSTQQRILLAVVLAFVFFALYDHYLVPKTLQETSNNTTIAAQQQAAPNTQANINAPGVTAATNAPISTQTGSEDIVATIFANEYEAQIDKFGRVSKLYLNGENFKDENGQRIQLIDPSFALLPLEVRFYDNKVNTEAFSVPYKADIKEITLDGNESKTLVLTQELTSLTITKTITFTQRAGYNIHVELTSPFDYFITPGFRPNVLADGYTFHGAIVGNADSSISTIKDGDVKKLETYNDIRYVAASDRYYTTLLASFDKGLEVLISPNAEKDPNVFIKSNGELNLVGYIGPKARSTIQAVDIRLDPIIEYGFFTIISKPLFSLLYWIHDKVGNWGWSIVIMTLLIRLVLYPLTYRGMVSMNRLKELAPKVKDLQLQYKDDKQKLNIKMMELYKKHNANPLGGCLPILLQIPIFFAIYRVLLNAIELKNAPWILWVQDLAIRDPYFILPILMGITMYLQQRFTPTNFTDPMQEKIMRMLPIIFTFFFLWFPAGLTLYWFTNNLFSVAQQLYVNRLFDKKREARELAKKEKQ